MIIWFVRSDKEYKNMHEYNTTYLVNGNVADIDKIMDGALEAPRNETFFIITNEKCPEKNRQIIADYCKRSDKINERIIKHSKNSFSNYVKSIQSNYINSPMDRVVIMPQVSVSGPSFSEAVGNGLITIKSTYRDDVGANQLITANKSTQIMEGGHLNIQAGGKMHILIDYENVHYEGLIGTQYLNHSDHVMLFYSNDSITIQNGAFEELTKNAGSFDMVKLKQVRRNGLDFYIATCVGRIIENDPNEKILIVSRDQGYLAVMDYCKAYAGIRNEIQLAESVESGLILLDGDTERRRSILAKREVKNLETEYALYKERRSLYEKIKGLLYETPYIDEIERIFGIMEYAPTPKEKYTATLHAFGIKRGQEIYRIMKKLEIA